MFVMIIKEMQIGSIRDLFFNRSYYSIELGFIVIMAVDNFLFHSVRGFFFLVSMSISILSVYGIVLCANVCAEEQQKKIEEKFAEAVELARSSGIKLDKLINLLTLLYEEDE